MLKFFREKAALITWIIVAVFVLTMFAGLTLFHTMGGVTDNKTETAPRENWVYIGDIPVDAARFNETLSQMLAPYAQGNGSQLDPQMGEMLQFSALMQAVNYTVLREGARASKLKVTKEEREAALQRVYVQYDLKDHKALKETLKKNNYPYKAFIASLEDDILAQKFLAQLQASVVLTNQDVDNTFSQIRVQHVLFSDTTPTANSEQEAKVFIDALNKGISFADALAEQKKTEAGDGDIGWVSVGMLPRELEKAAFSLGIGEWTQPIKTLYGYHIVRVTDRQTRERPATINYTAEKELLLPKYQQAVVEMFIQSFLEKNALDVREPVLAAYYHKTQGNLSAAEAAYQSQISQTPYDPKPHYMLAHLYSGTDLNKALTEIKKAKIKIELAPNLDFASLHVLEGSLLRRTGQPQAALEAYDTAIRLAKDQLPALRYLQAYFKEIQDSARLDRVTTQIATLEKQLPKN